MSPPWSYPCVVLDIHLIIVSYAFVQGSVGLLINSVLEHMSCYTAPGLYVRRPMQLFLI